MTDHQIPIFDGHNDVLARLRNAKRPINFFSRSRSGHIDFPRAKAGGLAGGFFAAYVSGPKKKKTARAHPALDPEMAQRECLAMTGILYDLERTSKGRFKIVRNTRELRTCLSRHTMAAIMHFEGAEAIDPELTLLDVWYRAGLRSLGIVWSRPNAFGYGVPFTFPGSPNQGPGLTPAGKRLIAACNRLGIMIDCSHLNEKGFWDVVRLSKHPVVATHSAAHALSRSPRNLTDLQLKAIKASGGVVGVVYYPGFLREDGKGDERTPLEEIVRHVEYLTIRMGIDHVALGSDFDGAPVPKELKDVSGLPKIVQALRERGYKESEIKKMATGNWIRVLQHTWKK